MKLSPTVFNQVLSIWGEAYDLYAPKRYAGKGIFSDTDCVRYGIIQSVEEIIFDQKAEYSFKEVLLKHSERLFYFTENQVTESAPPAKKPVPKNLLVPLKWRTSAPSTTLTNASAVGNVSSPVPT